MTSKTLSIILVVSVAINLLLVGYLVGNQSKRFPDFDPTRGYASWAHTLPDERSKPLIREIREQFRENRPPRMRRLHRQFNRALRAETLDVERLRESLTQIRGAHGVMLSTNHDAFIQFVSALSPEERRQLANSLQTRPPSKRHRPGSPPIH